ncbi:MAG: RsmD family RNA methyltransferase [Planctomycetota bacterium]
MSELPEIVPREVDYELLDFGDGRKLERFGEYVVIRPSPAAEGAMVHAGFQDQWRRPAAEYDLSSKRWIFHRPWPESIAARFDDFRLLLQAKPAGHIGCFPEQQHNWRWLTDCKKPFNAINLFAHTGGATLAMASRGCSVTHLDASKPAIELLRYNQRISGLAAAPIRSIVDDAGKFVAREAKRGRRYGVVVLDPPAYGHDHRGRAWRIERDLWPLMDDLSKLLDPEAAPRRLLLTGHSPQVGPREFRQYILASQLWPKTSDVAVCENNIKAASGKALNAGFSVRLTWD